MNIIGVTNRNLCEDFYKRIDEISRSNLKYLILREKDLDDDELLLMAKRVKSILSNCSIKLIINNNINVANKVNSYGVHLSYKDFLKNNHKSFKGIVGVSVHSFEEAIDVERKGADYIIYGHIYETNCKKGLKPRGLEELKKICAAINIPVYAIGGISEKNYYDVLRCGVSGVAIMSSLMMGKDLLRIV